MKTIICLLFVLTSISSYAQKDYKYEEVKTSVPSINLVRASQYTIVDGSFLTKSSDDSFMYLIDAKTKQRLTDNYANIDIVSEKEFIARKRDTIPSGTIIYTYGAINNNGEEIVPFIFDFLRERTSTKGVRQYYGEINGKIALVKNGMIVPTSFSASEMDWFNPFGICIVMVKDKYGIAKDGKIFIPAVYDFILPHLGKAQIATYQSKNRMGYVSLTTGKELTPPIFDKDKAEQFSDEYDVATKNMIERKKVRIQIDGKGGWVDNTGKVTMDK